MVTSGKKTYGRVTVSHLGDGEDLRQFQEMPAVTVG